MTQSPIFDSLALALDYLERHYFTRYIFPIKAGAKFPPLLKDNLDSNCSNDVEQIKRWSKQFPGCSWGLAHKKSGLMVADIDTKSPKVGQATYDLLEMLYGWPLTEKTTTPSGGYHMVYEGWADDSHPASIMALGKNGLGENIDFPNYTILPGCVGYVSDDAEAVKCPSWIYDTISTAKASARITNAGEIVVDLDKPENVDTAINFLQEEAEPSIERQGGDNNLIKAAMWLKDYGISQQLGAQLLDLYFNPRCEPVWPFEMLERKMASAYTSGNLSKVGGKTAEADFADQPEEDFEPKGTWDPKIKGYRKDPARLERERKARGIPKGSTEQEFYCHLPSNQFIFASTHDMWPPGSINNKFGKDAAKRIAKDRGVEQATWGPGLPMVIRDQLVSNGAWIRKRGAKVFNLYRPPLISDFGDARKAGPWLDLIKRVFPDDWQHIVGWFAWRVQRPDTKINHCIVLGGSPGIGKDTIIAGLRNAVGPWNCSECSPAQLLGDYTAAFLQSVILRVNEARDMGEGRINRYDFYESTKVMMADPPETLKVQAKYLNWYDIMNLLGMIITTNNKTNGLYLEYDDRRHYVAWSKLIEADFAAAGLTDPDAIRKSAGDFFGGLWAWYKTKDEDGATGFDHVAEFLRGYDLKKFNPTVSPPKTEAFWEIVGANRAPEETELAGILTEIGNGEQPDAVTLAQVIKAAGSDLDQYNDLYEWMTDRKNRRQMAGRFDKAGYSARRNPSDAADGQWIVAGKRQTVYTRQSLSARDAFKAVAALQRAADEEVARVKVERSKADKLSTKGGRDALN